VVVSTFEALVLCLFFFGAAVPAWTVLILHFHARRSPSFDGRRSEACPTARSESYIRIVNTILDELKQEENRAPVIIVCLRELRLFVEYRDITVLLLDEISVTGHSHFDQLMKNEITRLETALLANDHV
jgi:hypothetical protein